MSSTWRTIQGIARGVWRVWTHPLHDLRAKERIGVGVFGFASGLGFAAFMFSLGVRGDWFAWSPIASGLGYSAWIVVTGVQGLAPKDEDS